jgi:hypothetical protein
MLNGRMEVTEERINEVDDKIIKITSSEQQKQTSGAYETITSTNEKCNRKAKKESQNPQNLSEIWVWVTHVCNLCYLGG